MINLVKEDNGIGIISELVLNATPNSLPRNTIDPPVELQIGIAANDLNDLTPVAQRMLAIVEETCREYIDTVQNKRAVRSQLIDPDDFTGI